MSCGRSLFVLGHTPGLETPEKVKKPQRAPTDHWDLINQENTAFEEMVSHHDSGAPRDALLSTPDHKKKKKPSGHDQLVLVMMDDVISVYIIHIIFLFYIITLTNI